MFVVREEQVAALGAARREVFLGRLCDQLRAHWTSAAALHSGALRVEVERGLADAARYGIVKEVDVARFVNLQMALGSAFDQDERYPWAAALLADPAIAPSHKVRRLCELAAATLAEEEAR